MHPRWNSISPLAHKADYIRSVLLYKYGGVWIDADTLVLESFSDMFKQLSKYDIIGVDEDGYSPNLGFLMCRARSPLIKLWKQEMERTTLQKKQGWIHNITTLSGIVFDYAIRDGYPYKSISEAQTYIIPFSKDELWFQPGDYTVYRKRNDNQPFVAFSGSAKRKYLDGKSQADIIHDNTVFSGFVREGLYG